MKRKSLTLLLVLSLVILLLGYFGWAYIKTFARAFSTGSHNIKTVTYKPIEHKNELLPYEMWEFQFTTAKELPVRINLIHFLDENNHIVQTFTPTQFYADHGAVERDATIKNHDKILPYTLIICWNSIAEKRDIQTNFLFKQQIQEFIRNPVTNSSDETQSSDYRNNIDIMLLSWGSSLAKLHIIDKNNQDPILVATGESIYGDKMTLCQDKNHPEKYSESRKTFIKGKEYR
ncbi:DUF2931 family protein [Xenorhabdus griffiniae]|uniref:DUF2931 family protein n=1 Tax=Xenorhabdus griffiniae TaxID=351672 RepID=UPI002359D9BA|nr:DUF2931 family protein [Xenorhabdus griffiniae]MDC9607213.1 DUF2931 family protein [Xenorhabdus griffiniae]